MIFFVVMNKFILIFVSLIVLYRARDDHEQEYFIQVGTNIIYREY